MAQAAVAAASGRRQLVVRDAAGAPALGAPVEFVGPLAVLDAVGGLPDEQVHGRLPFVVVARAARDAGGEVDVADRRHRVVDFEERVDGHLLRIHRGAHPGQVAVAGDQRLHRATGLHLARLEVIGEARRVVERRPAALPHAAAGEAVVVALGVLVLGRGHVGLEGREQRAARGEAAALQLLQEAAGIALGGEVGDGGELDVDRGRVAGVLGDEALAAHGVDDGAHRPAPAALAGPELGELLDVHADLRVVRRDHARVAEEVGGDGHVRHRGDAGQSQWQAADFVGPHPHGDRLDEAAGAVGGQLQGHEDVAGIGIGL